MAVIAPVAVRSGFRGLVEMAELIGEPLEAHQKRIARTWLESEAREVVTIAPKGNHKTTTVALAGVHELLSNPDADVIVAADSERQANIALRRMKGFAQRPAIADRIEVRHWEMRSDTGGILRVVSSDGPGLHGVSPSMMIGDEPWCWSERAQLLEAMESSLIKRAGARLLLISTAAARLDGPLGRLRTRAMSQPNVRRKGVVLEAWGPDLRWLEWSLPESASTDDWRLIKKANPAGYITTRELRLQKARLPEPQFLQFHCGRWGVGEGTWLPPRAWESCAGDASIADGEQVIVAVDIGGKRSASAIAIVTPDLRVNTEVYQGEVAVLKVVERLLVLNERYNIREVAFDPQRFQSDALRLRTAGLTMVEFPQSPTRLTEMSEGLLAAIVERRLTHGNDETLNSHVADAVAVQTDRGWRLSKPREIDQVDAIIAVGMAVHRAQAPPPPTSEILGWL